MGAMDDSVLLVAAVPSSEQSQACTRILLAWIEMLGHTALLCCKCRARALHGACVWLPLESHAQRHKLARTYDTLNQPSATNVGYLRRPALDELILALSCACLACLACMVEVDRRCGGRMDRLRAASTHSLFGSARTATTDLP
jgi:hypothetical protein